MLISLPPIVRHPAPKAPHFVPRRPDMRQPKAERGRNLLRYVLAGARTSHTRSAAWVRAHGTREMMAILWRESSWGCTGPHFPRTHLSSAFGLGGMLAGTYRDLRHRPSLDPHSQIEMAYLYCDARFGGSWPRALASHRRNGWW